MSEQTEVTLEEQPVTEEIQSKFKDVALFEPSSVAFLQDVKGQVVAMGIEFADKDKNTVKISIQAEVFVAWSIQMAQQIGASYALAKKAQNGFRKN